MPTIYNIFQLSQVNTTYLNEQFQKFEKQVDKIKFLNEAVNFIQQSLVFSINFKQARLEEFLENPIYKNAYEIFNTLEEAKIHFHPLLVADQQATKEQ